MNNGFYWHGNGEQGGPESSFDAVKKHLIETERRGNFRAVRVLDNRPVSVEDISL
jgi:hypothetical protein